MEKVYIVVWCSCDMFDSYAHRVYLAAYDSEEAAQNAVAAFNEESANTAYSWAEYETLEVIRG